MDDPKAERPPSPNIGRYSAQYKKQVKDLVVSVHQEYGFSYDPKLDYDLEDPQKFYIENGGTFFLLMIGTKVIGTIAVKRINNDEAEIKRMYVVKEYRGKGWGSKLLQQALDFCKERILKKITLDTTEGQHEAQRLYENFGFKVSRKEKGTIFYEKYYE